jgi:hypothetical protein
MVSLADNNIIYAKDYKYVSEKHKFEEWGRYSGSLLSQELLKAYGEIGKSIYAEQLEMPASTALHIDIEE